MNNVSDDLSEIVKQLDSVCAEFASPDVTEPPKKLEEAADKIKKAWSGSWLGYHSRVYYRDFRSPPPGAHFSQEWGLMSYFTDGTTGEWVEYEYDDVRKAIYQLAGNPDLEPARNLARKARALIEDKRIDILSVVTTAQAERDDPFLSRLVKELDEMRVPTADNIVDGYLPRGQFICRDSVAAGQGFQLHHT